MSASGRERAEVEVEADGPPLVAKTWVYRTGRWLVATHLRLCHGLRVERAERLPREGGCLIVANHQSFLDIAAVAAATRRHVCFVARDSLARSRFLAWVMRESGAVLIRRGRADRTALRAMAGHLEAGDLVAVYPEGTRSADGSLGVFRPGALLPARTARVPIVPAGIRGSFEAFPRSARFPTPGRRIGIRFGEPIPPEAPDAMERAREAIAAMIGDGTFGSVPPL